MIATVVLLIAALATSAYTLTRPPAHDGLWLFSVLFAVAAIVAAAHVYYRNPEGR